MSGNLLSDGGPLALRLRAALDRFRTSLFGVPALWMIAAIGVSQVLAEADRRTQQRDFPAVLDTTVDSARSLLGAITSGTITAASVVFSLTLLAIQMSSSTYSSRVIRTFIRDRFQQHMIGLVLGTFVYAVLVLRETRGPLEDDGTAYIPRMSVAVAIVLALAALLGLLASINHTANQLRVSAVSRRIADELLETIDARFGSDGAALAVDAPSVAPAPDHRSQHTWTPTEPGLVLEADTGGWVQQISTEVLLDAVAPGATIRLDVTAGTYVLPGAPLLTRWPAAAEAVDDERGSLRSAFVIGDHRTMQQDIAFGLVTIEDIALRALSPGVNDPNTARSIISLQGEVVLAILVRQPVPASSVGVDDRSVFRPNEPGDDDYVGAAFDQIIHFAAEQAAVLETIIHTVATVGDELIRRGRQRPSAMGALQRRLDRVTEVLVAGSVVPSGRARLAELLDDIEWYRPGEPDPDH